MDATYLYIFNQPLTFVLIIYMSINCVRDKQMRPEEEADHH